VPVAVSNGMRAVKLCSNKTLQFLTGVPAKTGYPVSWPQNGSSSCHKQNKCTAAFKPYSYITLTVIISIYIFAGKIHHTRSVAASDVRLLVFDGSVQSRLQS